MKFKANIFVNFFLFFFFFLTTDFIATSIYQQPKKDTFVVEHHKFHHHFKANIMSNESFNDQKYTVITNSLGFRDKKIRNIDYENIGKRLVLIGDSFTEGTLLNYEDTFAGMIDDQLSGDEWEVLNLGVSSYSPIIYYNKIKYFLDKGLKFTHLAVFIDISDIEDEAIVYYYDENLQSVQSVHSVLNKFKSYLRNNFFLTYNFLHYFHHGKIYTEKRFKSSEEYLEFLHSDSYKRDKWTINHNIYAEYQTGINNSLKYMKLLKLLLDKHNIKMYVAVYPWSTQLYFKDLESIQVKIWKKFSQENEVEFINLFPLFINKNDNSVDINKKIKKYYFPFDVHFNKEGNKIIADYFLKFFNNYSNF
jgi:hypothetical protein